MKEIDMMVKLSFFYGYIAFGLAKQLPWRKKSILFGSAVCEYAAVVPMAEAGFFLGAALALADRPAAEYVVKNDFGRGAGQEGVDRFLRAMRDIVTGEATYETLFPSHRYNGINLYLPEDSRELLDHDACTHLIGESVWKGVGFGLVSEELLRNMLSRWIQEKKTFRGLNVGGLRVREGPSFSTLEQAYEAAKDGYRQWRKMMLP